MTLSSITQANSLALAQFRQVQLPQVSFSQVPYLLAQKVKQAGEQGLVLAAARQALHKAGIASQNARDLRVTLKSEGEGAEVIRLREMAARSLMG